MENEFTFLKQIKSPEITTTMLMGMLTNYSDPRKKINALANKGLLKSLKQGVYLVTDELGLRPYSKEILANLIYGPSYISLETALSFYGFIPERVTLTTSICFGRGKSFSTPVGDFEYHHVKDSIYPHGVQLKEVFEGAFCQFASPEKAILDFLYIRETKGGFKKPREYFEYILDSYRFDLQSIAKTVQLRKIQDFSSLYSFQTLRWFVDELTRRLIK